MEFIRTYWYIILYTLLVLTGGEFVFVSLYLLEVFRLLVCLLYIIVMIICVVVKLLCRFLLTENKSHPVGVPINVVT